jgi:hypothetical protein
MDTSALLEKIKARLKIASGMRNVHGDIVTFS